MTELRARIVDALEDQAFWGFPTHRRRVMAKDAADVVLSLPGIAVVDTDDPETLDRVHKAIWDENGTKYDGEGNIIVVDVVQRHRNMARAALLAAAEVVA